MLQLFFLFENTTGFITATMSRQAFLFTAFLLWLTTPSLHDG
jgi:hypothetical protein